MNKLMKSLLLGILFVSITQKVVIAKEIIINNYEINNPTNRVALRYYFKKIPPVKYKKKIRINYYSYGSGFIGVYL